MDLFSLLQNQMGFFLLMFARLTGIFSTAPVFGSRNVPVFAKAGLGLSISYLLLPVLYRADAAVRGRDRSRRSGDGDRRRHRARGQAPARSTRR